MASSAPLIGSAGEGALLIRFGTGIDLEVSEAVLGCLSRLDRDESSSRPDGITDIVPAYAALLVHFDPLRVHRNAVMEWVRSHLSTSESKTAKQPRQIEIPVQYGGKHGLDIDEVAQLTSLGSAAGQPQFLPTDLPPLAKPLTCLVTCCRSCADSLRGRVPRLLPRISWGVSIPRWPASAPDKRPEARNASGEAAARDRWDCRRADWWLVLPACILSSLPVSLTIGLYACHVMSGPDGAHTVRPGGWHLLGKTTMTLFDPSQDPPAVLRAGDLVKFVPVAEEEEDSSMAERKRKAEEAAEAERAAKRRVGAAEGVGSGTVFEILVPDYCPGSLSRRYTSHPIVLRVRDAMPGTDTGPAATVLRICDANVGCIRFAMLGTDIGFAAARLLPPRGGPRGGCRRPCAKVLCDLRC
eukprot:3936095-Rhodomonas_salina.4